MQDAKKTIHMWLEKFEATTWKNKKIEELSKGMQQKIQFIVTVMHNPDFIILDEPFTGFDPKNTQLIKDEIQNLKNNGASIMLSTHRMENVEAICDNVVLLNKAKVVAQGSVMDVRRSLKTDLFELACTNSVNPEDISGINIVSTENKDGLTRMVFSYQSTENLAALAAQDIQIKEYREVIPSMQEVFLTLTDSDHE
jgi:ABC-2 type transport system ATP-binding protein